MDKGVSILDIAVELIIPCTITGSYWALSKAVITCFQLYDYVTMWLLIMMCVGATIYYIRQTYEAENIH